MRSFGLGIAENVALSRQLAQAGQPLVVQAAQTERPIVLIAFPGNPMDGMTGVVEGEKEGNKLVRLHFSGGVVAVAEQFLVQTGVEKVEAKALEVKAGTGPLATEWKQEGPNSIKFVENYQLLISPFEGGGKPKMFQWAISLPQNDSGLAHDAIEQGESETLEGAQAEAEAAVKGILHDPDVRGAKVKAGGVEEGDGAEIDWKVEGGQLVVTCNPAYQAELKEGLAAGRSQDMLTELIDTFHQDGEFEFLRPEEVGALTDAPIFGKDVERDDQGNVTSVGDVFWYPQYETKDPMEELAEKGTVSFAGAPENKKAEVVEGLKAGKLQDDRPWEKPSDIHRGAGTQIEVVRYDSMGGANDRKFFGDEAKANTYAKGLADLHPGDNVEVLTHPDFRRKPPKGDVKAGKVKFPKTVDIDVTVAAEVQPQIAKVIPGAKFKTQDLGNHDSLLITLHNEQELEALKKFLKEGGWEDDWIELNDLEAGAEGFKVGDRVSDGDEEGTVVAVAATPKELVKQNQDYLAPITALEGLLPAERFKGGGGGNILDTSVDPILVFKTDGGELVAVFVHEAEKPGIEASKVTAAPGEVPSRGSAPQKDELQKKARENVTEKVVEPQKVEKVKPKNLPVDKARTAPEAPSVIKTILDRIHALELLAQEKSAKLKVFRDELNLEAVTTEYKTKAKELYDQIAATGAEVVKVGEVFLAIDVSREVTEVNMSEETKREKAKLESGLEKAEAKVAKIGEEIEALEAASFTRMGGTETVSRRVSEFKDDNKKTKVGAGLIASQATDARTLRLQAGLKEMFLGAIKTVKEFLSDLKSLVTDAKGFMSAFKKDVAAAEKAPKPEPVAASKKVEAGQGPAEGDFKLEYTIAAKFVPKFQATAKRLGLDMTKGGEGEYDLDEASEEEVWTFIGAKDALQAFLKDVTGEASDFGIVKAAADAGDDEEERLFDALVAENYYDCSLEYPLYIELHGLPGLNEKFNVSATPWVNDPDKIDFQLNVIEDGVWEICDSAGQQPFPPRGGDIKVAVAAYKKAVEAALPELVALAQEYEKKKGIKAYNVPPGPLEEGHNPDATKAAEEQMQAEFKTALQPIAQDIASKLQALPKIGDHPEEKRQLMEALVKMLKDAL